MANSRRNIKRNARANFQRDSLLGAGAAYRNNPAITRLEMTEQFYVRKLTDWSMSRFKWVGMPDTVDVRFIEKVLFFSGQILFYWDKRYERYLAVRSTVRNYPNMYDNPTSWRTISTPGYDGTILESCEAVPIYANYTRVPELDIVMLYARRLADLDISLEINARNMRMNKFIVADEGQRLSVTNALNQIEQGNPAIFVNRPFDLKESFQTLDLSIHPDLIETLRTEKNQVWNEACTMLGITNTNKEKKERLVADEATGSDGAVLASRNSVIKPRAEACEQINRMFGLAVSVEWELSDDITPGMAREYGNHDSIGGDAGVDGTDRGE